MTVFALIGVKALYLLYAWLVSAALAGYLSERKGYGQRAGLASGLLLFVLGLVIWIFWPAREGSKWKTAGIIGSRTKQDRLAEARRDGRRDSAGQ
jgi:fucose permease